MEIISAALFFGAGLIVGWNFMDQPVAVRAFVYKWQVKLGLKKDNDFNPDN